MAATATAAMRLAESQKGMREMPSGSNHTKYGVWYGVDPAYWCAMFMSWVWWGIGLRFSGAQSSKGWASAELMRQWFIRRGRITRSPRPGDVVFIHVPGGHAGANHVGFFMSKTSTSVTSLDGNTSSASSRNGDSVAVRTRPIDQVLGYGRPPYVAAVSTTTVKPPTWWTRTQTLTSPYMKGTDVAAAGKRLTANGHPTGLPVDVFGPQMDAAVRAFQKAKGLVVDGDIGPATATKLGG